MFQVVPQVQRRWTRISQVTSFVNEYGPVSLAVYLLKRMLNLFPGSSPIIMDNQPIPLVIWLPPLPRGCPWLLVRENLDRFAYTFQCFVVALDVDYDCLAPASHRQQASRIEIGFSATGYTNDGMVRRFLWLPHAVDVSFDLLPWLVLDRASVKHGLHVPQRDCVTSIRQRGHIEEEVRTRCLLLVMYC